MPGPAPELRDPTFAEFAARWFEDLRHELAPATQARYDWELTQHLLPFFADHRLSEITIAEVDRYRTAKLREGRLGATSINMTLAQLAQIIDTAIEYHPELLRTNTARGRRRRLRGVQPRRTFLELEQVAALLEAAGELDARAVAAHRQATRRAMLGSLVLGGLRIGELLALRWGDVDLAAGRITVRHAKTSAGLREVEIGRLLGDALSEHRTRARSMRPEDLVFATASGRPHSRQNVRQRVLLPALDRADAALRRRGAPPMPAGVSPHSLRRTYISLMLQAGENPRVVMAQVGHTDPDLTLRIYAQVMKRRERETGARVDELLLGASAAAATLSEPPHSSS